MKFSRRYRLICIPSDFEGSYNRHEFDSIRQTAPQEGRNHWGRGISEGWLRVEMGYAHTSVFFVEHAIMSFTATRNSPPVSVDEHNPGKVTMYRQPLTLVNHVHVLLFGWALK